MSPRESGDDRLADGFRLLLAVPHRLVPPPAFFDLLLVRAVRPPFLPALRRLHLHSRRGLEVGDRPRAAAERDEERDERVTH